MIYVSCSSTVVSNFDLSTFLGLSSVIQSLLVEGNMIMNLIMETRHYQILLQLGISTSYSPKALIMQRSKRRYI